MSDSVFRTVVEAWHNDPEFRAQVGTDAKSALASKGFDVPHEVVQVVVNTPDTCYMVLPENPNADLTDEALEWASGGVSQYYLRMAGCYWGI